MDNERTFALARRDNNTYVRTVVHRRVPAPGDAVALGGQFSRALHLVEERCWCVGWSGRRWLV